MAEPDKRKIDGAWVEAACHLFEGGAQTTPDMNLGAAELTRDLPDADLEKLLDAMMRGTGRPA